jgi:hypothetical protein
MINSELQYYHINHRFVPKILLDYHFKIQIYLLNLIDYADRKNVGMFAS